MHVDDMHVVCLCYLYTGSLAEWAIPALDKRVLSSLSEIHLPLCELS